MTESEAIEELKYDYNELGKAIPCDTSWGSSFENAYRMAIQALEEVQQYRAIGTPEELQDMKRNYFEALSDWRQYRKIGTLEECQTAVEKQTARNQQLMMFVKQLEKLKKQNPFINGIRDNSIEAAASRQTLDYAIEIVKAGVKYDA